MLKKKVKTRNTRKTGVTYSKFVLTCMLYAMFLDKEIIIYMKNKKDFLKFFPNQDSLPAEDSIRRMFLVLEKTNIAKYFFIRGNGKRNQGCTLNEPTKHWLSNNSELDFISFLNSIIIEDSKNSINSEVKFLIKIWEVYQEEVKKAVESYLPKKTNKPDNNNNNTYDDEMAQKIFVVNSFYFSANINPEVPLINYCFNVPTSLIVRDSTEMTDQNIHLVNVNGVSAKKRKIFHVDSDNEETLIEAKTKISENEIEPDILAKQTYTNQQAGFPCFFTSVDNETRKEKTKLQNNIPAENTIEKVRKN